MDPWDPYSFSTMGSTDDPFANYYAPVDYSTQFAPTARSPYGDAMVSQRDVFAPVTSESQVPGTSGSPAYTPSATPGGVSQSDGTGTASVPEPSAPYDYGAIPGGGYVPGALAAMLGPGTRTTGGSSGGIDKALKLGQFGLNYMKPQPSMPQPQQQPGPAQIGPGSVQQTAQQQQIQQIQKQYGVDYQTAVALYYTMLPSGGGASQPYGGGGYQQLPQMAFGGRPTGPTIVGERGPELFVPDVPGSIVPSPRRDTGYDAILRAMELGARIQRRRLSMPEELY